MQLRVASSSSVVWAGLFWGIFALAWCLAAVRSTSAQESLPRVPATLSDAQSELSRGNYTGAETLYEHLLLAAPRNRAIIDGLALTLYLQGRDSEAIAVLLRDSNTKLDEKAFALLASGNCRLRHYGQAADALRHLKPWPEDDALLEQIASCITLAGDPLDGIAVYQELIAHKAKPEDELAVGLTRAYIQGSKKVLSRLQSLQDSERYIQAIDSAQSSNSTGAASAFEAAEQAIPSLSRGMSVDAMETLLREHPNQAAALYGVGVILGERGMAAYSDAADRFPGSVPLLLFQAEMLIAMDRKSEAIAKYQEILQDHPDTPGMHFRIGEIYGSDHHNDEALVEFRLQEKITPADERVSEAIGNCLIAAGRFSESYGYLKPLASAAEAPESILINFATSSENSRFTPLDNVIDVQIARLRKKVDDSFPVKLLQTVRGMGFILREPEA
jgi:tetratricopeptide (TPR) repeat protein